MKTLELEQMENFEGGIPRNTATVMCAVSTTAWALGALTSMTGFGLALWVVGGVGAMYCNCQSTGRCR